jgi:hypothetical protein
VRAENNQDKSAFLGSQLIKDNHFTFLSPHLSFHHCYLFPIITGKEYIQTFIKGKQISAFKRAVSSNSFGRKAAYESGYGKIE